MQTISNVGEITVIHGKRFEFLRIALLGSFMKGIKRALKLALWFAPRKKG